MHKIISTALFFTLALSACKKDPRFDIDISAVDLNIEAHRFDQIIHNIDSSDYAAEVPRIRDSFSYYYDLFSNGIINIGASTDANHIYYLHHFLADSIYRQVYDTVQVYFPSTKAFESDIINGLKRFHVLFPQKSIPQIFFHISGFNESIVVGREVLSISLENYLGEEHPFYKWLGIYAYKRAQYVPEKIVVDALMGWISTELESGISQGRLVDQMMHRGKLAFLMQHLLPDVPLHLILGITEEEYAWCNDNETNIWTAMVEWKHLFSKDRVTIKKHLDNAPFNSFFGEESAPKSGVFIGWKIVTSYMKSNKQALITDLFKENDGQKILQKSNYRP